MIVRVVQDLADALVAHLFLKIHAILAILVSHV
jgi:hypothetical protein